MRKVLLSFWLIIILIASISALTSCNIEDVSLPVDYEIDEPFESVSIDIYTATVEILPTEEGVARVSTHDSKRMYHSVYVKDGVLTVEFVDDRQWFDYIFIKIIHLNKTNIVTFMFVLFKTFKS